MLKLEELASPFCPICLNKSYKQINNMQICFQTFNLLFISKHRRNKAIIRTTHYKSITIFDGKLNLNFRHRISMLCIMYRYMQLYIINLFWTRSIYLTLIVDFSIFYSYLPGSNQLRVNKTPK